MLNADVILFQSFAQAELQQKRAACNDERGVFGRAYATFPSWIASLWELHGDGRALVSKAQRAVFAECAVRRHSDMAGEAVPKGLAGFVQRLAAESLGVPPLDAALDKTEQGGVVQELSEQERTALSVLADYRRLLAEHGLVELGDALRVLAGRAEAVFPSSLIVDVSRIAPLTWQQRVFFDACPQIVAAGSERIAPCRVEKAPDAVQIELAFPSGRYAQPATIADMIRECPQTWNTVVACKDPVALFDRIAPALAGEGFRVVAGGRKPFCQTDFGRAYRSMLRCVHEPMPINAPLADVLSSPFSGIRQRDAFDVDARLRADRALGRAECLAPLRAASELFSQLEELALDPEADILLGTFEQVAESAAVRGDAWKAEQRAAISALRSVTSAARMASVGIEPCISLVDGLSVSVAVAASREQLDAGACGKSVLITTLEEAADSRAGGCDMLVLADMTADDYPAADRDDSFSLLMGKLGCEPYDDGLDRMRRMFNCLAVAPSGKLAIVRPLNDESAEPTYPCAVLEEFVNAYLFDAPEEGISRDRYGLPSRLKVRSAQRGEELLFANARALPADARQELHGSDRQASLEGAAGFGSLIALPRRMKDGGVCAKFAPSPSQVELYLECPQKWFVQRRLDIEELGEQFGPLEVGTFAHSALQLFYQGFQQAGHLKVNEGNMAEACALMNSVVEQLAACQCDLEPGSGRLVAVTQLEKRELESIAKQLEAYLQFEMRFLPTFHPAFFELSIGLEDAVEYAGHPIVGVVDRIDVDDAGHAVIVDYKGSLGSEYEIGGKDAAHVGKVQTRMYAQAVKRMLGLDVVGALYASYGRVHALAGAYDPLVLSAGHLPFMKHARCRCVIAAAESDRNAASAFSSMSFSEMLDSTEAVVSQAIERMEAGKVAADPSHARACDYCPALACPNRGA